MSTLLDRDLRRLIAKYDTPGPRYTSYPPAPRFNSGFGPGDHRSEILRTELAAESTDLSLYFHFPFCDTLCYFCGCTTIVTRNRNHIQEYLGYLGKEISLLAPMLGSKRKVVQLHWGGGTPTYLSPSQIGALGRTIMKSFRLAPDAEVSVEVDPRDLSYHHLRALRDTGFNRISLGVQDFNPRVQQAVNRNQSEFITRQAISWARELGFASTNIDLIYGLPLQTAASFRRTLDIVRDISPERIAVYNFAYVPWMKKQQQLIHPEDLPSPDTKLDILTETIDTLSASGYAYIGMDHFAKLDDELTLAQRSGTLRRNFQGYSTRAGSDMYALGMSSISHYGSTYAQNAKTLPEYYEAVGAGGFATRLGYRMSHDDQVRKHVIMALMCDLTLDKRAVERRFGIAFDEYFSGAMKKLTPFIEDGLLSGTEDRLEVTGEGRLFLRNIAMSFDATLADTPGRTPAYSRTV